MCMCAVAGVDETVIVTLKFSKSRMAVFTCSAALQLPNDAIIVGTKGTIKVGHHGDAAQDAAPDYPNVVKRGGALKWKYFTAQICPHVV